MWCCAQYFRAAFIYIYAGISVKKATQTSLICCSRKVAKTDYITNGREKKEREEGKGREKGREKRV